MQNAVLSKARVYGTNWGSPTQNAASNYDPPYLVKLMLNEGYNNFLARTMNYPIAAIKVSFPTRALVTAYTINPIPPSGGTINPSALRVYELTYTPSGAQERRVVSVSTARFRAATNEYKSRLGVYSSWPQFWSQLFGRRQIDIWPGTAVANDVISLTICPDPQSSPAGCPAANGGVLVNDTDVPLIPPEFHQALVHYAVSELCEAANAMDQANLTRAKYEKMVEDAINFGSSYGEGDPEQSVIDIWDDEFMR
jgi:hypothetical protein